MGPDTSRAPHQIAQLNLKTHTTSTEISKRPSRMSEAHFDEFEHYNFDQDKAMRSGHSGKQRTKKEASMNTNKHNPGGHERKIVTKLMNAEKNNMNRVVPPVGGGSSKKLNRSQIILIVFYVSEA